MRIFCALVLTTLLLIPGALQAFEGPKSTKVPRYDTAVARAAAYLKSNVAPDKVAPGHLVLAAYALFKAGEPVDSPFIQEGLKTVLGSFDTQGFHPHHAYDHLYESGLFAMFLADVDTPEKKFKPQLQAIADYVARVQRQDGSWADTPQAAPDVSMCQYAVLALWAAHRHGCQVSPQALDRTASFHLSHRNNDGGWTYRPGTDIGTTGAASSRNMTMAAISTLGITRLLFFGPEQKKESKESQEKKFGVLEADEEPTEGAQIGFPDYRPQNSKSVLTAAIDRAIGYEVANFNPVNVNKNFPIYFYYSAERALSVTEITRVADKDWYLAYGDGLLSLQTQAGAFNESFVNDVVGTSFAILYFMRSTQQIIDKTYGLGLQAGKRGNPFGDKAKAKEPTELDLLIGDLADLDTSKIDETPVDFADEIVRSVTSIDDPAKLVGQADKLRSLVRHPNSEVRKAACWALGRTGDFKLIPLMLDLIRDPNVDVNVEAIAALRYISRKPGGFGETLNPLEGHEKDSPEDRTRIANDWRQKTLKAWSAWYNSIRPFEDKDSFDELQLAVPVE